MQVSPGAIGEKDAILPGPTFMYVSSLVGAQAVLEQQGLVPRQGALFPLSTDHLIPVVQYNLMRATVTNMDHLGMANVMGDCQLYWGSLPRFPRPAALPLPPALAPTRLQLATPHERWIDLLPHPRMRDNAIRAAGAFSWEELEEDLMGFVCDTSSGPGRGQRLLLVWDDPARSESYELTPGLLRKWWFLVRGCDSLLEATNRWRQKRGELPLRFGPGLLESWVGD